MNDSNWQYDQRPEFPIVPLPLNRKISRHRSPRRCWFRWEGLFALIVAFVLWLVHCVALALGDIASILVTQWEYWFPQDPDQTK